MWNHAQGTTVKTMIAVVGFGWAAAVSVGFAPLAAATAPPDVIGKKYGDASGILTAAGFEPVVSTTVGDRAGRSDCIVTSYHQHNVPPPPNSRGAVRHQLLVSLNCDAAVASGKTPGPSAASVEGRAAKSAAKG